MSHVNLFISAVSDEFGSYRDALRRKLAIPEVDASIQEDFYASGSLTLENLDDYISSCTAVIHLAGDMSGSMANQFSVDGICKRYPDLGKKLPCMKEVLDGSEQISYTQWEAMLALYHDKHLFIAVPEKSAPRSDKFVDDEAQKQSQLRHLERLRKVNRHADIKFADINELLADIALSKLLKLLIPSQQEPAETLYNDGQSIPSNFVGRDEELKAIRQKLNEGGRLVLINAEGGIGKTTLAAKYWQESLYDYRYNAWLFCEAGIINKLKELALKLHIDLSKISDQQQQIIVLKDGLQKVSQSCLLVLDNADKEDDIEYFQKSFRGFQWHVLITSRRFGALRDNAQEYHISHLPPPHAKALFKSNYKEDTSEFDSLLDRFLEDIDYHTLLIEIFSKYMHDLETDEKFADVLNQLETKGLFLGRSSDIKTEWLSTQDQNSATIDDILNTLYDFLALSKAERYCLVNMALLPAVPYRFSFLCDIFQQDVESFKTLKQLASKGWLTYADKTYRISPVIQSIAIEKNKATLTPDAAAMIDYLNGKLEQSNGYTLRLKEAAPYAALVARIVYHLIDAPFFDLNVLADNACTYFISTGNLGEALKAAKNVRTINVRMDNKEGLAASCQYLGNIYEAQGKQEEALQQYKEYNRLEKELYDANPDDVEFKNNLAISCQNLGKIYVAQGRLEEALQQYKEFNRLEKELYDANPDNVELKNELAISCQRIGNIYGAQGKQEEALQQYKEYNRLKKELYDANPDDAGFKNGLAASCQYLGNIYEAQGRKKEALRQYEEFNRLEKELYDANPDNVEFKNGLAISCQYLGSIYKAQSRPDEALQQYKEYNRLEEELYNANPDNVEFKNNLAISRQYLGSIYEAQSRPDEALQQYKEYNRLEEELYNANPDNVEFKVGLASSSQRLGSIYEAQGRQEEALQQYEEFNKLEKELYDTSPDNIEIKHGLASSYLCLGHFLSKNGKSDHAILHYRKGEELLSRFVRGHPGYVDFEEKLSWVQSRLSELGDDSLSSQAAHRQP